MGEDAAATWSRVERTTNGGIILAIGKSRRQIEALVEADPFYKRVLAWPTFGSSSSEPVNVRHSETSSGLHR